MNKESLCLSSLGLKNINREDKDFIFIFGEREVRMNNLFAEFFSPLVSRLHLSDPTINSFSFDYSSDIKSKLPKFNELISDDILLLIQDLSSGSKVLINEEQSKKLLIISVLIDNEELFREVFKLFTIDVNHPNFDRLLNHIQIIESLSLLNKIKDFDLSLLIDTISSNFYAIDENQLKKLSKPILLSILSNNNLKIKDEDSLLDFIQSMHNEEDDIYDIDFYEQICISCLSETKFKELLMNVKLSEMTTTFWEHICSRICDPKSKEDIRLNRYYAMQYAQSIIVGGYNRYNQLMTKANNKDGDGNPIISPPLKLSLDSSSFQSFSIYDCHTVEVRNNGSLLGIGKNSDGRISISLPKTEISQFTEFCVRDSSGSQLTPVSAVCCLYGTLYMFTKSGSIGRQLFFCDKDINDGKEVFLDTGNQEPVALFGGYLNAAAISSEGEVIFINRDSVRNSPSSPLPSFSLPDGEKASSVACCADSVVVLSSCGRVFASVVELGSSVLSFSAVVELSGEEIVCVSGVNEHCLCVSREGRVFVRGSNLYGQLGLGEGTISDSSFTAISSLSGYKIRAAYAGGYHSLFETHDGKILSCGSNDCGQLLLSSGASGNVYFPRETKITDGATFCIAGGDTSVVFIGGDPPPNTPNRRVIQLK